MPLSNELHQPWWSKHLSGPLGNNSIKKRGREEVGEVKGLDGGEMEWTEKGGKNALNGYQTNAGKSVVPDDWQCTAKYVLETKPLSSSWAPTMNYTTPPPTPQHTTTTQLFN